MKLGKLAPQHRSRYHLADYLCASPKKLLAQLPQAPDSGDWEAKVPDSDLRMWGNDKYGDCAWAAQANAEQTWASMRGQPFSLTDQDVYDAYASTGWRPDDSSTDRGTVMADALDHWQKDGIGGRKIAGHVAVDHRNWAQVRLAAHLFGGVYFGAALPQSAQGASTWIGKTGALSGDDLPGSWGGHAIWMPKWQIDSGTIITWQHRQPADVQWWLNYVDECYAPLSVDWADLLVGAPNGFDFASLAADLALIGS